MSNLRVVLVIALLHLSLCTASSAAESPEAVLKRVDTAIARLHAISADVTFIVKVPQPNGTSNVGVMKIALAMCRPNYLRADVYERHTNQADKKLTAFKHEYMEESDGHFDWFLTYTPLQYRHSEVSASGTDIRPYYSGLAGFFRPSASFASQIATDRQAGQLDALVNEGTRTWQGTAYTVIRLAEHRSSHGTDETLSHELYVGAGDLVYREVSFVTAGARSETFDDSIANVRINPRLKPSDFVARIPNGATVEASTLPATLPVGTPMPQFTVLAPTGKKVSSSEYDNKVTVVDFWASWCIPCQEAIANLNQVRNDYQRADVTILAINVWDTDREFHAWLKHHPEYKGLTFLRDPAAEGDDIGSTKFKISAIPSLFVIDRTAHIRASFVGGESLGELKRAVDAALSEQAHPQPKAN